MAWAAAEALTNTPSYTTETHSDGSTGVEAEGANEEAAEIS